jgi:tetratricopeptide (TPR) repeat protein
MNRWRWPKRLIALMLGGISLFSQTAGDRYFEQREYQQAMQAYIQMLQVETTDGRRIIRYSPEVMTRIGICAFHMSMLDASVKVFKYVQSKTPAYALATLYLGLTYEKQEKLQLAQDTYAEYNVYDMDDPAREAMKARYYYIQRSIYKKSARNLAARGTGPAASYPVQSMVVLDLIYSGQDQRGSVISEGLTALVIDDLSHLSGLQVVPRDRVVELIHALDWQPADLKNPDNLERLQQMLGVGMVVYGELLMPDSNMLNIRQRTLTFTGVRQAKETNFEGSIKDLVILQKRMVLSVLKALNYQLNASQINELKSPATQNLGAFFSYAFAIHALDQGRYTEAQEYFRKALDLDPRFIQAELYYTSPDIFEVMQSGDWAVLQTAINGRILKQTSGKYGAEGYDAWVSLNPIDRLQEMGTYLDAGFIPGSDSRNPFEEIDLTDFFDQEEIQALPDPPNPPGAHYPEVPWYLPDPPAPPHRP